MKPLDDSPTSIFLLLPLEKHTVNVIVDTLTHDPWLCDRVTHLRIEKAGRLVFNAGDNFHPECISIDEETNKDLLDAMVGEGLIHIA